MTIRFLNLTYQALKWSLGNALDSKKVKFRAPKKILNKIKEALSRV
jgi:hypothetical protein